MKLSKNTVIKLGGRNKVEQKAKVIRETDTVNTIQKCYVTVKPN